MKTTLLIVLSVIVRAKSNSAVSKFTSPSQEFNHVVIDNKSEIIYASAGNEIYELNADLKLRRKYTHGPNNNLHKVLLIDYSSSNLIACGSASQTCTLYKYPDFTETQQKVVAGTPEGSTVAFIGPGLSDSRVLYVAATSTSQSEVPAVSTRSLNTDNLLTLAGNKSKIHINPLDRDRYLIKYVYGFSSGGFSYFLTTQKRTTTSNEYTSKLIRICQNDEDYNSYTEVPIHCTGERIYNLAQAAHVGRVGTKLAEDLKTSTQDDVLFVVFSQSEFADDNNPSNFSAMCVYPLKRIRKEFAENIGKCFKGIGQRGLDFITPDQPCIPTQLESISEDFCELDINTPLGGHDPITTEAVAQFNAELTAVTVTVYDDSTTVAFVGTSTGHLKKILIKSGTLSEEQNDVTIDEGSRVNADLLFDNDSNLLVAAGMTISKINVGCCGKQKRPTIVKVTPEQIQVTTGKNLNITVEDFPETNDRFQCTFALAGKTFVTDAQRTGSTGFTCTTPNSNLLPAVDGEQSFLNVNLSISTEPGQEISTTNLKFYDCRSLNTCTRCVSSDFPCDWCVDGHRCTHDTSEYCRNDILVTGVKRMGPSYRSGPNFCPKLFTAGSNEILIPSGTKRSIQLETRVIGQFIVQSRFFCSFNIQGRIKSVNAQLLDNVVYCDRMDFTPSLNEPTITASLAVVWGGSKPLDNPNNIHIVIYNCAKMADTLENCSNIDKKFNCSWCHISQSCNESIKCEE